MLNWMTFFWKCTYSISMFLNMPNHEKHLQFFLIWDFSVYNHLLESLLKCGFLGLIPKILIQSVWCGVWGSSALKSIFTWSEAGALKVPTNLAIYCVGCQHRCHLGWIRNAKSQALPWSICEIDGKVTVVIRKNTQAVVYLSHRAMALSPGRGDWQGAFHSLT